MRQSRFLVVSGGTGAGHQMAARAVEAELAREGRPAATFNTHAVLSPLTRWAYTRAHVRLLELVPELYGPLIERGSRSRALKLIHQRLAVRSQAKFNRVLDAVRPRVVLATYALGCVLAAAGKPRRGFRLAVLTTDYRAHEFQVHSAVDAYCASHAGAASDLVAAGIAPERVAITGIPLRPQFDNPPSRARARAALGLPAESPVVLVTRGGVAAGRETVHLLRALLAAPSLRQCAVVAVLGRQPRSYRLVSRAAPSSPRLRVERFVARMEVYLAAADVVVGKAGGLSSTETFAVGRPLVIYAPNEGIETANVQRLVAAGAALYAHRSPARVVELTRTILADSSRRRALVAAGRALIKPRSRQAVAQTLVRLAEQGPAVAPAR